MSAQNGAAATQIHIISRESCLFFILGVCYFQAETGAPESSHLPSSPLRPLAHPTSRVGVHYHSLLCLPLTLYFPITAINVNKRMSRTCTPISCVFSCAATSSDSDRDIHVCECVRSSMRVEIKERHELEVSGILNHRRKSSPNIEATLANVLEHIRCVSFD